MKDLKNSFQDIKFCDVVDVWVESIYDVTVCLKDAYSDRWVKNIKLVEDNAINFLKQIKIEIAKREDHEERIESWELYSKIGDHWYADFSLEEKLLASRS